MRNKSLQPGKQPENTLRWVENSKPKLFRHLLVQQIANSYFIDFADRIKLLKNFVPHFIFGKKVIIE